MATDNAMMPPGRRARRSVLVVLALGLTALIVLVAYSARGPAAMAAAYDARLVCSCRHVAGRSLDDCRRDRLASRWPVWLSEDAAAHSISATVPLVVAETARWHAGQGCLLDPRSRESQATGSVASIQPPPITRSPA